MASSHGSFVLGALGRSGVCALVVSAALGFGCSGKSSGGGDDDGDDETGGTNGAGTGGGGTGGFGATGGSSSGGTGASSTTRCVALCERANECPGADVVDCPSDCQSSVAAAASYGCSTELERYLICIAPLTDVCNFDPSTTCTSEVDAFIACMSGDPSARCTEGAPATGVTCVPLCERSVACTGETSTCSSDCADAATNIATSGCTAQYQSYMNCAASCENICAFDADDCPTSYTAFVDCFSNFCLSNPSSPACSGA